MKYTKEDLRERLDKIAYFERTDEAEKLSEEFWEIIQEKEKLEKFVLEIKRLISNTGRSNVISLSQLKNILEEFEWP